MARVRPSPLQQPRAGIEVRMKVTATPKKRRKRVAIAGGGIAGLSAAHELISRGYSVCVYEANTTVGGKARSQYVPDTGTCGRADLPGEHGYRFIPAFYKHLPQTMAEIPVDVNTPKGRTVADNLIPCDEAAIARPEHGLRTFLRRAPRNALETLNVIELWLGELGVPPKDVARFASRLATFMLSGEKRRLGEYERQSWQEFLRAGDFDPSFQRLIAAVTRTMVAMDFRYGSARTIGGAAVQVERDHFQDGAAVDRTLNGPTTEAWLAPWKAYLERLGVQFVHGAAVSEIMYDPRGRHVTSLRIHGDSRLHRADHYVLAVPLEVAVRLVTNELAHSDPQMAKLREIARQDLTESSVPNLGSRKMVQWMTGIQFYLRKELPLTKGHVFFPESPWAVSSISQAQFWNTSGKGKFAQRYGNGEVVEILSVDVSDCGTPGILYKKPAYLCNDTEFKDEVFAQIQSSLNTKGTTLLSDDMLVDFHIDDDIPFVNGRRDNHTPLLAHAPGTWHLRPTAATGIHNLVLAGDYVQNGMDLATMEGANESARHATNEILRRDGYVGMVCDIWERRDPEIIEVVKSVDDFLYEAGLRLDSIRAAIQGSDRLLRGLSEK